MAENGRKNILIFLGILAVIGFASIPLTILARKKMTQSPEAPLRIETEIIEDNPANTKGILKKPGGKINKEKKKVTFLSTIDRVEYARESVEGEEE